MARKECLLLIFIKNPHPGKVKTRLGKSIGHTAAVAVYKKLLARTRQAALEVDCTRYLYYGDYINPEDEWPGSSFEKRLQVKGDLGDRMRHAFASGFEEGYERILIIGSDCPEMNAPLIEQAFETLKEKEVVLGPALDGGYYLLGMNRYHNLFDDVAWSTDTVFETTLQKIKRSGASFDTMPQMSDLDTIEDLKKYPELQ